MYTGLGGMSLHQVAAAHVTSTEVCSKGYKRSREGRSTKSLGEDEVELKCFKVLEVFKS
jgi:hypothetical protein